MPDYIEIINAKYLEGYKIQITFNDKTEVIVDFEEFLSNSQHPGIKKYLDVEKFKAFQLCDGDLDWNNFDLCFPVSDLYTGKVA